MLNVSQVKTFITDNFVMRKGDVYTLFCLYVLQQIMQNKRINTVLLPGRLTVIGL